MILLNIASILGAAIAGICGIALLGGGVFLWEYLTGSSAKHDSEVKIEADPNNAEALFVLVDYDTNNKDFSKAIERLEKFLLVNPNSFEAKVRLGCCYYLNKEYEKAEPTLQKTVMAYTRHIVKGGDTTIDFESIMPWVSASFPFYGYCRHLKGDFEQAKYYKGKAIELFNHNPTNY